MLQRGGQKLNSCAEGRTIQCRKLLEDNAINNSAKFMELGARFALSTLKSLTCDCDRVREKKKKKVRRRFGGTCCPAEARMLTRTSTDSGL
jgi:hypothetical protein